MSTHNTEAVKEAKHLFRNGWKPYSIAKLFKRRGNAVSETTVTAWVDPETAERRRAEGRQRARAKSAAKTRGRLGAGPPRSPEFKIARMRSLRDLGVSYAAIATVMNFDFPDDDITEMDVRQMVSASRNGGARS